MRPHPFKPVRACRPSNPIGASGMIRFSPNRRFQVMACRVTTRSRAARKALGHSYGRGSQYYSMWSFGTSVTLTSACSGVDHDDSTPSTWLWSDRPADEIARPQISRVDSIALPGLVFYNVEACGLSVHRRRARGCGMRTRHGPDPLSAAGAMVRDLEAAGSTRT